jgi:aminoglycoside 3'-phosphotransferase-2
VIAGELVEEQGGLSGSVVLRATHRNGREVILKGAPTSRGDDPIQDEAERLRWLSKTGFPCPVVHAEAEHGGWTWLLMDAIAGHNATEADGPPPETIVRTAAAVLRRLHALPPDTCPFDMRVERRLDLAEQRASRGQIDAEDFDADVTGGRTVAELIADLRRGARVNERDLVVTHGDACLENIIVDDRGGIAGLIDVGRLGVAGRVQDLALMARSIDEHFGSACAELFWTVYGGARPDPAVVLAVYLLEELG